MDPFAVFISDYPLLGSTRFPSSFLSRDREEEIPWFSRVWTIQEVAVAREVIVVTKKNSIAYDHLVTAWVRLIMAHKRQSLENLMIYNFVPANESLLARIAIRDKVQGTATPVPLLDRKSVV